MNAALTFGVGWSAPPWSHPITGTVGCCARTASGHAAAVPPSRLMNSRLFTASNCIEMSSWDEIAGQHIKSLHGSHEGRNRPSHDHEVLELVGQLLDTVTSGNKPSPPPEKRTASGYRRWEPERSDRPVGDAGFPEISPRKCRLLGRTADRL